MSRSNTLKFLRREMLKTTEEIFRLCAVRFDISRQIVYIKIKRNIPIVNNRVEEVLRENVLEMCRKRNLNDKFCLRLLDLILEESRRIQISEMTNSLK